ncbi:HIT domain-containing protein [Streptomyces bambusae]|uniref:HIT family protein n=1 Tax=Streptomyces bambusae TaxID=1550616 RepID=UPI001CFD0DB1|nr:HIT domain-containing protein [Streptomyces bambusae]MCB5167798.1 HIT domain-containing protein [Streptomyces bambusae]
MTGRGCHTCAQEAAFPAVPPRERIAYDAHWRVAHATGSALPGRLVLLPRRHVTAVHDLTDAEAAGLGHWQVRLARALRDVTGCTKAYVVQFAEAEGFAHVHFHLVPRAADHPAEYRGPRVFGLLKRPPAEQVTDAAADALAGDLAALLEPGPGSGGGQSGGDGQSSGS